MHLSILSDAFVSDRLADAGIRDYAAAPRSAPRAHWEGVLRGLACLGVFAVLIALALLSDAAPPLQRAAASFGADTAPFGADTAPTLVFDTDVPEANMLHRLVLRHE